MEDSRHQHMEDNIKHIRHQARLVNGSHSECKAGMGDKRWNRYHTIEKEKPGKYNVSETLSDKKKHNIHDRRKSEENDSLYVIMTSCEQAMQSSVHGKFASRTYATGLEKDNVAQRRMQENRDKEEHHQLKGKMEYIGKYMPYLVMQSQEKGVDRESKAEQNSYSKARINLPSLLLQEDGLKGDHNLHNKRGDLNRRDLRRDAITEKPLINQKRLSAGKPVRDNTHIHDNKRVALPPPPSSGRIVCAFSSSPIPKFQNSKMSDIPLSLAGEEVHINGHTNLADGPLSSEEDNCIEKQTANKITTVSVQSGFMKDFPSGSSTESATDTKSNKGPIRCDTYTVLTHDKKQHDDVHLYTQLQHDFPSGSSTESATDTKSNKGPIRCDTYTVLTRDKKEDDDVHLYTQIQHGNRFAVTLITTDASCKCQFIGYQDYMLTVDRTKLHLSDKRTPGIHCEWPYTAIRRITADHSKNLFQIEAGRKCSSGPGIFRFYAVESRTLYKSTMQAMTGANKTRC